MLVSPQPKENRLVGYSNLAATMMQRLFIASFAGAFLCAKEAVLRMLSKHGGQGGKIINISSRASVLGSANEFIDYAASKGAIDTLTIGLANEVSTEGIRVNAVHPRGIKRNF